MLCYAMLRVITLKTKNSQSVNQAENELLNLTDATTFNLFKPLFLQICQLGNVVSMTKQHLHPTFPELPTQVIAGYGGYYGTLLPPGPDIDDSIHNLYEEIPCLGVVSEAVKNSIGNAPPGPYQSQITFEGLQPNNNLLGFRHLGYRREEAKNLAFYSNIFPIKFPSYPINTGFNFEFLFAISNVLANIKKFENIPVVFSRLSEVGRQSQLIIERPIVQPGLSCLRGKQQATSVSQDSPSTFDAGIFFDSQLLKEPAPDGDQTSWCLFHPANNVIIPQLWVNDRNDRRNLPMQYMQIVFNNNIIDDSNQFRVNIIKTMR